MDLTDEQWLLLQPLITPHLAADHTLGGRPPIDERRVLDGILYKLRNNLAWYHMPSGYPSYQTCYRRYRQWLRLGVMQAIFQTLYQDCLERGGVDVLRVIEDGLVSIESQNGQYRCIIRPDLLDSWQLPVILLFLGMVARRMKTTRPLTIA